MRFSVSWHTPVEIIRHTDIADDNHWTSTKMNADVIFSEDEMITDMTHMGPEKAMIFDLGRWHSKEWAWLRVQSNFVRVIA